MVCQTLWPNSAHEVTRLRLTGNDQGITRLGDNWETDNTGILKMGILGVGHFEDEGVITGISW